MDEKALIQKIGTKKLMVMFGITKGAISYWRKHGIPKSRLMYLELTHPSFFEKPKTNITSLRGKP
jgi:hypothetical protein